MLDARQNVRELTVDEYTRDLLEYFRTPYREVERIQEAVQEKRELSAKGRLSAELRIGDVVLVKREVDEKGLGPVRFQPKVYVS